MQKIEIKGIGSYSKIWKSSEKGKVIKSFTYTEDEYPSIKEVIEREIKNYKIVQGSIFFPKFYGVIEENKIIRSIVIEECEASLYNYINKNISHNFKPKMDIFNNNKHRWVYQIIKTLQFMNSINFIHGDISSINICVALPNEQKLRDIKFIDLGGCRDSKIGNHRWQCEEALFVGKPNKKFDMYSVGAVLWEIESGEFPYEKYNPNEIDSIIKKGLKLTISEEYKYKHIIKLLLNMQQVPNLCEKCDKAEQLCEDCAKGGVFGSSPR